jgi:hypothetical protein
MKLMDEVAIKLVQDARRYHWLKATLESAKGGASLDVNEARAYYETPEPGTEVTIQWYPDTPVGFHLVQGTTLDEAIDKAMEAYPK